MKLFQHSSGAVIAFGFDMAARKPQPRVIAISCARTGEWEASVDNAAEVIAMGFDVLPEFVVESPTGDVVAYQPGLCITLTQMPGNEFPWAYQVLRADPRVTDLAA